MSSQAKAKIAIIATMLLALIAACIAGYLAINSQEVIAGCGQAEGDCDAVLASAWSRLIGIPVAWLGTACYATLALGALLVIVRQDFGWRLIEFSSPLALITAFWFIAVQAIFLKSFCVYCLAIHSCGILAFIFYWLARRLSWSEDDANNTLVGMMVASDVNNQVDSGVIPPPPMGIPSLLAYVASALLIVSQVIYKEPTTRVIDVADLSADIEFEVVKSSLPKPTIPAEQETSNDSTEESTRKKYKRGGERIVPFLRGKLNLNTYTYPLIGVPEAEFVIVEIMDYTCPHCREFNEMIHEAVERYDGKLAVIVLPYAGELLCNPYIVTPRPKSRGACRLAKLGIGLSLTEPEAYEEFHNLVMKGERPPSYISALSDAQKLVDKEELGLTLSTREEFLQLLLEQHIKLFASMQKKVELKLPMLLIGDKIVSGRPESMDIFYTLLEDHIGLKAPSVTLPF